MSEKFTAMKLQKLNKIYDFALIIFVFLSVFSLYIEQANVIFYEDHNDLFKVIELVTIIVFTVDYFVKILLSKHTLSYLKSFEGLIDLISILPFYLGLAGFIDASNLAWLRVFRILKLTKCITSSREESWLGGVNGLVLPFVVMASMVKLVIFTFEELHYWPKIENVTIIIGVIGFALAILLGTKLNVVYQRLFTIEDTVCRIVGSLRDIRFSEDCKNIQQEVLAWSKSLEEFLLSESENKLTSVNEFRYKTDQLEIKFEKNGIGGPQTAGFHRDVAFLIHRATSKTPIAFDHFLVAIMFFYVSVVILLIPSITGFVSTVLIAYVLSGMYFLINDIEHALDFSSESFIDVRLDALINFNKQNELVND